MTLVKICGVRTPEMAVAAAEAGAHFVGIVFAESRRRVEPAQAAAIARAVRGWRKREPHLAGPAPGEIAGLGWFASWADAIEEALKRARPLVTGVFAGQTAAEVADLAQECGLDLVQRSGGEDWDFAERLPCPAVKVLHVAPEDSEFGLREQLEPGRAAVCMFDTGKAGLRGGTGEAFDWSVLSDLAGTLPFMLAGGLDAQNVAEAIETARPWAVDVSTGVETDREKDAGKIREFIAAVRAAG